MATRFSARRSTGKSGGYVIMCGKGRGSKAVGHSRSKARAKSAVRVRYAVAHGWKPTKNR